MTYRGAVGQISGFKGEQSLALPSFGDEQTADWADYKNSDGAGAGLAALVVRKGRIIWVLTVENCGVLSSYSCAFSAAIPPRITKALAVSELKKYAQKQKTRVGNA